jgi:hypothetical protein
LIVDLAFVVVAVAIVRTPHRGGRP